MIAAQASTFADLADVAAFKKWHQIYLNAGYSDAQATQKAFAKGDNGIGWTGLDCTNLDIPYVALPPEDWMAKWGPDKEKAVGALINVVYKGQTVCCVLGDTMPHKAHITNGCGMDWAPGTQKAFGVGPGEYPMTWEWAA